MWPAGDIYHASFGSPYGLTNPSQGYPRYPLPTYCSGRADSYPTCDVGYTRAAGRSASSQPIAKPRTRICAVGDVMTAFRRVVLGAAAGFALAFAATSANANSLSTPFSSTGFYLGGHAGYSWAEVSSEFAFPGDPYPTTKNNGLIGGVHAGYQRQVGQLVLGAEVGFTQLQNSDNGVPYPLAPVSSVEFSAGEIWAISVRRLAGALASGFPT